MSKAGPTSRRGAGRPGLRGMGLPGPGWAVLGLILLALLLYLPTLGYPFLNLDDDIYVSANPWVRQGITWASVKWAFTNTQTMYWHPLTWLSLMLDSSLFGTGPAGYRAVNVLLHVAATLAVFLFFYGATSELLKSFAVAALFCVHPIQVESVAWVAERKNLLAACLALLSLLAYRRYCRAPRMGTYLPVLLLFALAMLSKPSVATLPLAMVALDYWPLGRLSPGRDGGPARVGPRRILLEKVPLLGVALAASGIAYWGLVASRTAVPLAAAPLPERLAEALAAYAQTLLHVLWPVRLSVFYSPPEALAGWTVAVYAAGGAGLIGAGLLLRRRCPALLVGVAWYGLLLLPAVGLLRGGIWPFTADRFAYLPMVGVAVAAVWLVASLIPGRIPARALGIAAVLLLLGVAHARTRDWADSETLLRQALRADPDNYLACNNLGIVLARQGRMSEAQPLFRKALEQEPCYVAARSNLALSLAGQGRLEDAETELEGAVGCQPWNPEPRVLLGHVRRLRGDPAGALRAYREALLTSPDHPEALWGLGTTLLDTDRAEEAVPPLRKAAALRPGWAPGLSQLGAALFRAGRVEEAGAVLERALEIDPANADALNNLGLVRLEQGRKEEARRLFSRTLEANPDHRAARENLGALTP